MFRRVPTFDRLYESDLNDARRTYVVQDMLRLRVDRFIFLFLKDQRFDMILCFRDFVVRPATLFVCALSSVIVT